MDEQSAPAFRIEYVETWRTRLVLWMAGYLARRGRQLNSKDLAYALLGTMKPRIVAVD